MIYWFRRSGSAPEHRWAVVVLGLVLLCSALPAHARDWVEVHSENFIVVSDASAAKAQRAAKDLEEIRAAILTALPALKSSPEPLRVLAARNEKTFEEVLPSYKVGATKVGLAGLYASSALGDGVVLRLDVGTARPGDSPYHVIYHEYFHSLLKLSPLIVPRWLNEGLAELYGGTQVRDRTVIVGEPIAGHVERLRTHGLMRMDRFLRSMPAAGEASESAMVGDYYAQAWAITHMLIMSDDATSQQKLALYLQELAKGEDEVAAWTSAFDQTPDEFLQLLSGYVQSARFRTRRFDASIEVGGDLPVRTLSDAEVLAAIGFHQMVAGQLPAAQNLDRAVTLDPDLVFALESLAQLRYRYKGDSSARQLLEKARSLPGHTHQTPFVLGELVLHQDDLGEPELQEAEQYFLEALAGRDWFAPAWVELARIYHLLDATPVRTIAMLRRALSEEPRAVYNRFLLARALALDGESEEAAIEARAAFGLGMLLGEPESSNNLCWWGAIGGYAREALPLCEQAVRLAPDKGGVRDSRGVARAMTGNYAAAIDDFRFFVQSEDGKLVPPETREQREAWIRALEKGKNPLDEETLESISNLPF